MRHLAYACFCPLIVLLAACGSASNTPAPGTPQPSMPRSVVVQSDPDLDGRVRSDGFAESADILRVGDDGQDLGWRGFVTFALPPLAPGEEITAARLILTQTGTAGAPFADLGDVFLDLVDLGASLDGADYATASLIPLLGNAPFSSDPNFGDRDFDVLDAVRHVQVAGGTRLDLRLRFPPRTDGDGAADLVFFFDAESSALNGIAPPRVEFTIE